MTLNEYLVAEGLTGEEIAAIVGNEKQAKAMTKALGLAEEGRTAKAQADAEKQETAQFWEQKTTELQGSVARLTAAERRAAEAEGKAAQRTAYLKSLKDQGYDVPDEMIGAGGGGNPNPETPKYVTHEEVQKSLRSTAPDLVSLTALSNEYRSLYGTDYVAIEEDFRAAQAANKPLREFARSKYNFEGKKTELAAAADKARIDAIVAEKEKEWQAKNALTNGSNPNTRPGMPSKFDKLTKSENFKSDSWKSQEGRDSNRADRLKKFENIQIN
jgi:hypothetical protein